MKQFRNHRPPAMPLALSTKFTCDKFSLHTLRKVFHSSEIDHFVCYHLKLTNTTCTLLLLSIRFHLRLANRHKQAGRYSKPQFNVRKCYHVAVTVTFKQVIASQVIKISHLQGNQAIRWRRSIPAFCFLFFAASGLRSTGRS